MLQPKVIEAIGWTYSFLCNAMDKGIDPRIIEVPVLLEEAHKALEVNDIKPDLEAWFEEGAALIRK